jgi:hypothetical protein
MPLTLIIPKTDDLWDPVKEEFVTQPAVTLHLEHSLMSVSKWEAKYHRPFLYRQDKKSSEEMLDYIRMMTFSSKVDDSVYYRITQEQYDQISAYIEDPMTASTVRETGSPSREIITSELIYYWMISLNIPFECQKWHLNRLIMLIRVCSAKNAKPRKMSKGEIRRRNSALNAARRAQLHSRG